MWANHDMPTPMTTLDRPATAASKPSELTTLSIAALRRAMDEPANLFNRCLKDGQWQPAKPYEAITGTATALIGLHRAGIDPLLVHAKPRHIIEALARHAAEQPGVGALGLVIWANAVWDAMPLTDLLARAKQSPQSLEKWADARMTMEAAWLVSALSHEVRRDGGIDVGPLLRASIERLRCRFSEEARLFSHATEACALNHRVRRWVANFADQIYSVQALAFASIVTGDDEALMVAGCCADRLVDLQGDLGQWWWHYDPRTSQIAQAYPVYSVHQYGMAPMAMASLRAAGGNDFAGAVRIGRQWLTQNELGIEMIDAEAQVIHGGIEYDEGRWRWLHRRMRSVLRRRHGHVADGSRLRLRREMHTFEMGWALYAEGLERPPQRDGHLI